MYIINSFISNIQLSKININRRGKDVNLWLRSFGIVPSFVCETVEFIYNVLLIKKVIFLTLKKMFFFKYYRRNNSASIYEWDKKERENWVSGF